MAAKHELDKQKSERKILSLEKNRKAGAKKLIDLETPLSSKEKEIVRLNDIISTLKNERYISPEDANTLKVRLFA